MKYSNLKNQTIDSKTFADGLDIENCQNLTISNCIITGGNPNLLMLSCINCTIIKCNFSLPLNKPDESGNGPHSVLFDKCSLCAIRDSEIKRIAYSEMGIGLYMSVNCSIINCHIYGKSVRQSGDAITIDRGSKNCNVSGNKIDLSFNGKKMGHKAIVIGSGYGHTLTMDSGCISGSVEDRPISVASYYDPSGNPLEDDCDPKAAKVGPVTLVGFDKNLVYVGPKCEVVFK